MSFFRNPAWIGTLTSGASGGGGGPTPPMTNLLGWWKADALAGSNGASLASWPDSSGNGNDLTQSTPSLQPTLATNKINGLNAVRFTNQLFAVPNFYGSVTQAEIFGILMIDSDPPVSGGETGLWTWGGGTAERTHYPWTDGTIYDNFFAGSRFTTVNPSPSLAAWRCYNVSAGTNTWTSRLDGTQLFTSASNTFTVAGNHWVGASESVDTTFYQFSGWMAEILFYSSILSPGTRSQVSTYFNSKYGLSIA